MGIEFGPRRSIYVDITQEMGTESDALSPDELEGFEFFDLIYRSLCTLLFNYVPTSGHPGGSVSSGRIVSSLLFDGMNYDISDPDRDDADIISYAAGHKALGLYAMWALRNEVVRIGASDMLPQNENFQLRLEDLLGFRRNPTTSTPLYRKFNVKPLDGHPTPATPFVRLSTGASGVGLATSLGLAFGIRDYFGKNAPKVHIIEGEGGLTPGRVGEALAAAGTASLDNAILHVDWNQASIDTNHVCREEKTPGGYVQWTPMELAYLHDWNVIFVPDGKDIPQVRAAQRRALKIDNSQPTAIIYRTIKGWQYGIEGKASHGAGHKLCIDGFFNALQPVMDRTGAEFPKCNGEQRCEGGTNAEILEECLWNALTAIRKVLEGDTALVEILSQRIVKAKTDLNTQKRLPRENGPKIESIYRTASATQDTIPEELRLSPGTVTTLRGELGNVLRYYNRISGGAIFAAAADLLGSTSVNVTGKDFADGYYHSTSNPDARLLSIGGICEDAMAGILSGISSFGYHIGVGSSYGAFIAALGHIPARLHAIGNQARQAIQKGPYRPFFLVCAHAGLKTGEDGPTHADPQALQLLQENFPLGTSITLTPWDPQEMWHVVSVALDKHPAIIAPFVTRPNETIIDREGLGLAPASKACSGVYLLKGAQGSGNGTLVLQGSEVAYAFVEEALPLLDDKGIDLNVYYVASTELFDLLPEAEREKIFPEKSAQDAMGITGFTLPTMHRWIRSDFGRSMTLHPFQKGHYLGSGQAKMVLDEAGLDGQSQFNAIVAYLKKRS